MVSLLDAYSHVSLLSNRVLNWIWLDLIGFDWISLPETNREFDLPVDRWRIAATCSRCSTNAGATVPWPRSPSACCPRTTRRPQLWFVTCKHRHHHHHHSIIHSISFRVVRFSGDLEVTVNFLTEIDQLVQLIESPIFACEYYLEI